MNDSKIETNIVKIDVETKVFEKIYYDVGSPILNELGDWGKNIIKAVRLIGFPIEVAAYGKDKLDAFLKKSLANVNKDMCLEPQLPIVGPILDAIKFQDEDSITYDMLSNLFITSLDKSKINEAHPAFANIIRQLSPGEAIIVFYLNQKNYRLRQQASLIADKNLFTPIEEISNDFPTNTLFFPGNFYMYMNHLYSLNIAGMWQDGNQETILEKGRQTGVYINNIIQLTEFGQRLAVASIPESIDSYINKKDL